MRLVAITALVLAGLAAVLRRGRRAVRWSPTRARSGPTSSRPWGLRLLDEHGGLVLAEDPSTGATVRRGRSAFERRRLAPRDPGAQLRLCSGGGYAAELATNDPAGRTIAVQPEAGRRGRDRVRRRDRRRRAPARGGRDRASERRRRALPRVRRALAGRRPARQRGRELRRRRPVPAQRVAADPGDRAALGISPARGRDLLPGAVAALDRRATACSSTAPETSYFRLDQGGSWSVELVNAPPDELAPAAAPDADSISLQLLRRPEARGRARALHGRRPAASRRRAAPWVFGPWIQPNGGTDEQLALLDQLQQADAPISVAQTYLHYLPCGDAARAARAGTGADGRRASSAGSRSPRTSTRWSAPTTSRCSTGPRPTAG